MEEKITKILQKLAFRKDWNEYCIPEALRDILEVINERKDIQSDKQIRD